MLGGDCFDIPFDTLFTLVNEFVLLKIIRAILIASTTKIIAKKVTIYWIYLSL